MINHLILSGNSYDPRLEDVDIQFHASFVSLLNVFTGLGGHIKFIMKREQTLKTGIVWLAMYVLSSMMLYARSGVTYLDLPKNTYFEYSGSKNITIKTGEKVTLRDSEDSGFSAYVSRNPTIECFVYSSTEETPHAMIIYENCVPRKDRDGNNIGASTQCEVIGLTPGTSTIVCLMQAYSKYVDFLTEKKTYTYVRMVYNITVTAANSSKPAIEISNNLGSRVPKGTEITLKTDDPDADIYYVAGNDWKWGGKGSCIAHIYYNLRAFAVKKDYIGSDILYEDFQIIDPGDFHAMFPNGLDLHFNYVDGNKKTCELYYVPQVAESNFSIPKAINGYSIVSIGREAFLECTMLTGISIPKTVSTIDVAAFSGCTMLNNIVIPGTVVTIGDRAFEDCTSLKSVIIKEGVKEIPWRAFNGCSSLEEITFPESLQSIDYQAFLGCRNLKSVVSYIQNPFPLYDNVFDMGAEHPWRINLKSSDWEWTSATLYVPKGCKEKYETTSGWMLFKNIVEMNDEPELTTQGDVNGDGSVNGTDLVALANIILGKQTETAAADVNGDGAANGTDIVALCNIILGRTTAGAKKMSASSLKATNNVFTAKTKEGIDMTFMVLDEDTKTCQVGNYSSEPIAIDKNTTGTITIPSSVNGYIVSAIGNYAFDFCDGITSIDIPNSITSIGEAAFQGCTFTTINIPNSVTNIGDYAFNGSELVSVTLSDQIEIIGESAFGGCPLTHVTIPQGVKKIGVAAFYGCPLTTVIIPNSVTSIESYAFGGNKNLSIIQSLMQSPCSISLNSFSDEIYKNARLYVPRGCKGIYQSTEGWNKFSNLVEMDDEENPVIPVPSNAPLAIQPFDIKAGETKTMTINLNNPNNELTLVQFNMQLPTGLSIKTVGGDLDIDMCNRTNWRKHSLEANEVDGAYRFLLYSSSNTLISGTEGGIITINLVADNTFEGGNIVIDNTLLVSPEQEEIKPAKYVYSIGSTTGIEDITNVQEHQRRIYNLNGQQLRESQRGINIIDGKKVIVR